jgi:hypothetical protein
MRADGHTRTRNRRSFPSLDFEIDAKEYGTGIKASHRGAYKHFAMTDLVATAEFFSSRKSCSHRARISHELNWRRHRAHQYAI